MSQIQFKRFKWFLNARGGGDVELENSPDGWVDTNISYTRSSKYNGLLRSFTLPLKLVRQGAFMARLEFYVNMIMSNVTFRVDRLDDGIATYKTVFTGKLDFSKVEDTLTSFNVPAIPNDFSEKVDAYDSVQYGISLNDPDAINLELPPLALNEIANLLPSPPPDGHIHSDYFPPITVVNNQQNSVNPSVQSVAYRQFRDPDFSTELTNFYTCRVTGKMQITGALTLQVSIVPPGGNLVLGIYKQTGELVYTILAFSASITFFVTVVNINTIIDVTQGDRLFLYMRQIDDEHDNIGITITGGEIDLSYKTITPASMCKALRGNILFDRLLKAMNNNTDSGPNQPVPNQSYLLTGPLKSLLFTASDSIRAAEGSIYNAGDQLFPGVYKVIAGSVTYNSILFNLGDKFSFVDTADSFTTTDGGTVQKTQSIFIGNVYNVGESLQAGGTYLVAGDVGEHAVYNGVSVPVGQFFKYVLGEETFSVSDDSVFVKQVAEDPQIIISFSDFFQTILASQGGQAAFGIEKQSTGDVAYLEDLAYVYRSGINNLSLGLVDNTTKFEPAIDLLCNTLKVGYDDQQYDAINGSQEVNSTQTYQTLATAPQKELDLISPTRMDPYGIETVRITQNDSAASRSDNDVFGVWINENIITVGDFSYVRPLGFEGLTKITGVDQSYYNWFLSPKQNLLRGGRYLASIFYGMKGYQIMLASALKNSAMVTWDLTGRRVAEADPVNVSDLPAPLFIPIYATIVPGLSEGVLDLIDSSPYADMNFDFNGVNTKAFINKFSVQIGNDKPTETKLLLTPDNDLTKMIR